MAKDPYKYFRVEARELVDGLTQGVLELERGAAAVDRVARLLRLAHTLKGAARVVKQPEIAELAHAAESILTDQRAEPDQSFSASAASELLRVFDRISQQLQSLASPGPELRGPAEDSADPVRVDVAETDALLRGLTETLVQFGSLRNHLNATDSLRTLFHSRGDEELLIEFDRFAQDLMASIERLESSLSEVQETARRLRMIPAKTLFSSLDRAVRDAAQALGRVVHFEVHGGEVQLDAGVLASLRSALMHVVRNAVTHGIETPPERAAAGKPIQGRVELLVKRRGGRVSFVCQDDGRGVDLRAVRDAAAARGLLPTLEVNVLNDERVLDLLRAGGLSTSGGLTQLSGRGIGLDVVRAATSKLKGEFRIQSDAGRGARFEIEVPVSVASMQSLLVESAGRTVAIPLDAVSRTFTLYDTQIAKSANGESILHQGRTIPFLALDRVLRRSGHRRPERNWPSLLVAHEGRQVAVGVDALLGATSIVVRPLPAILKVDPAIAGASLDAEGDPQLVLDPAGLVAAAEKRLGPAPEPATLPTIPILVVDDSLTTRMLEQSILESAGYQVDLAVSGEEGLEKARKRRYGLFLVDVEMPGIDGFEFVTRTRADPHLSSIPAILVTSRNAIDDRRRGEQAGARAYIVKGEFDQGHLLRTIRELVG